MAQQLVEKKGLKNHELARTGRMALYGGGACCPSYPTSNANLSVHSNLRTRSNNLVQVPPKQSRPQEQERRDHC